MSLRNIFIGFVAVMFFFMITHCDKQEHTITTPQVEALIVCDSFRSVRWGDTLRVVPNTITRGFYKGHAYWQAMLYSNNLIEPTKFKNTSTSHRFVIADTTEINYNSIFICGRSKI